MRPADGAEERKTGKSAAVRRTAQKLPGGGLDIGADISDQHIRELIHELSVHQIELELQNEELRRSQHALEVSHQRYVALYDGAPVGYVTLDNRAVIKEANFTIAELLGVPVRVLINGPFILHVDPAFRSSFFRFYRKALASETGESCITSLRSSSGRAAAVRLDTRVVPHTDPRQRRVLMSLADVTQQKKLEDEITFSDRKLRLTVEQYPAMFVIFGPTGCIEFVNSHGAAFLGRSPEELIGAQVEELTPQVPEELVQALKRAVETAAPQRVERVLDPAGRFRDHAVTLTPVADSSNHVRQVLVVAYDDSAQKKRQEDLERAVLGRTSELREANETMKREAVKRKALTKRLVANESKLRAMSSELIMTAERERQRLAVALHDRIGQALAFARFGLGLIRRSLSDEGMAGQVDHILSVLDEVINDTQSLIFDLSPPVLSLLGLGPALEWLADKTKEEH
ncbi:MAG: PAS domain-containing protein, partial [Armatimonadetes bacterium]|nr:PAS domain-containing protein [Armatimonadota bacterium]